MRRTLAIAVITAALFSGCCCHPQAGEPAGTQALTRTELYFGLSRPDGGEVTGADWNAFLNDTVTPLFPAGLTVIDAHGQWREDSGKIAREPSRILLLIHPPTPEADEKIEQIRALYKQRFSQEAVMRTDTRHRVSF